MSDPTENPLHQLNNIADTEKYLLKSRDAVVASLLDLSKKPDFVTAYYDSGKQSVMTTVVDVLQERDLVIMEFGPNKESNRQLLDAGHTTCTSRHNDIDIRFQLTGLRSAKYKGQQVFAAPVPETLLRLQRREFFRVNAPLMEPITCCFDNGDDGKLVLPLADISIGGLAMIDAERRFKAEQGAMLEPCTLNFPDGGGKIELALEIRALFLFNRHDGQKVQRIGCAYHNLSASDSHFIQRYINQLQIQQKNLSRG